jgi:hypothetical protein
VAGHIQAEDNHKVAEPHSRVAVGSQAAALRSQVAAHIHRVPHNVDLWEEAAPYGEPRVEVAPAGTHARSPLGVDSQPAAGIQS